MAEMDLPDIDLEGRVVIMTGADRGLGRARNFTSQACISE